jgi:hypothetical protein
VGGVEGGGLWGGLRVGGCGLVGGGGQDRVTAAAGGLTHEKYRKKN